MLTKTQRGVLFWTVCIPLRYRLATLGNVAALRLFAGVIGYRWVTGQENGNEGVFGGPTWWAEERYVHGVLWSLYAATGDARFLKTDTLVGVANWFSTVG